MGEAEHRPEERTWPPDEAAAQGGHAQHHDAMLRDMRATWLWTNATVMALGVWLVAASTAVGLWLMFAPAALGSEAYAAANDNLAGALIVTVAVISTAEVVRAFGFLNALIGIWLLLAPWALVGASIGGRWSDMICGAALILLTLPRGIVRERYGAWDTYVV